MSLVKVSAREFEKLRLLYSVFQTSPFSYQDAKDHGIHIIGPELGSFYRGGILNRVGHWSAPNNRAHLWQISEKAVETLKRRGGLS